MQNSQEKETSEILFVSGIIEELFMYFLKLPILGYSNTYEYVNGIRNQKIMRRIVGHTTNNADNVPWFIVWESTTYFGDSIRNSESLYLFDKYININDPNIRHESFLIIQTQFFQADIDKLPEGYFVKGKGMWLPNSEKIVLDCANKKWPSINLSSLQPIDWRNILQYIRHKKPDDPEEFVSQYPHFGDDERTRLNVYNLLYYIKHNLDLVIHKKGCWQHDLCV